MLQVNDSGNFLFPCVHCDFYEKNLESNALSLAEFAGAAGRSKYLFVSG